MADPFDHDTSQTGLGQAGAGKRPAPTIEGTATEVSVNEAADWEARDASAASHDDEPGELDEAATPEDETGPEPETVHAQEDEPESTECMGPPPAASISELTTRVTHL